MRSGRWLSDLVYGLDELVAHWVSERCGAERGFGQGYRAIGVSKGNSLIAGFVYHDWFPEFGVMEMSLAADSPKWASRRVISALLQFPFVGCGVQRIGVMVESGNDKALRLAEGVGFEREAVLERAYGPGRDAVVLRLFREDWEAGRFGHG